MKSGSKTIRLAKKRGTSQQPTVRVDLCDFCGGVLGPEVVDLDLRVAGELVVCEELPAEVCRQCGERYFSAAVSEKIDHFLARYRQEKPSRYLPTPVYSKEQVL